MLSRELEVNALAQRVPQQITQLSWIEQPIFDLEQGWPNYDRIRPADRFNPARQTPCTFFQAPRFRLWTAVQEHWLLSISC